MKKIVAIGEILVEIMAIERGSGFRSPILLIGPYPSGAPAIFIDQAARLGQPCGLVGSVGDDDFGHLNVERLRGDGVDVSAIAIVPGAATGSAFVRYRADGQRDFVFNIQNSACGLIAPSPESLALIDTADHLHVMGSSLFSGGIVALTRQAVERVKAKGGTVSFDPNIRKEILGLPGLRDALQELLAKTDLFLPSGPEVFLFSDAASEREAVADIFGRGVGAIVVKRGSEGASHYDRAGETHVGAFAVEEVDPTGAGDCFGATFTTAWLRGAAPREALTLANAAGALAVGRKGPMEGVSSQAEIAAFLDVRTNGARP